MSPIHDKLKRLVDQLTERQALDAEQLLASLVIEPEEAKSSDTLYVPGMSLSTDYDPTKDPILTGELSFSGATDLGRRSEEILEAELGLKKRRDIDGG